MPNKHDPIARFATLFAEAAKKEPYDHTAFVLSTSTPDGFPSSRMVLLKEFDQRGFVFYSNRQSRKGGELAANPRAAMCFHYPGIGQQVRVEGRVELVSDEESDAYFASRARDSQIGAWASDQSRPLKSRTELLTRCAKIAAKYGVGKIPRPHHWGGYRIVPDVIEFWINGPFRLHDRFVYQRKEGGEWAMKRLFP